VDGVLAGREALMAAEVVDEYVGINENAAQRSHSLRGDTLSFGSAPKVSSRAA
jgi:hypothetical protein